ncbi:MAG TPA: imidazole glycerol phosphate synthase subunit HisH [Longimicrobiales bacterium]|nr:imidazole glycerol phosphate synthase subunit HisH [Longimicrobiales bacterium]
MLFDYGAGNLHSLAKALRREGAEVRVTPDPTELLSGDAVVLPGVGAFDAAAEGLAPARADLRAALLEGHPCLGICLGLQLLLEGSEEGTRPGIGAIAGSARRIRARRVPQMGWNTVNVRVPDPLFEGLESPCMYFANSFVACPDSDDAVLADCEYLGVRLAAAVRVRNAWGVQFHPEKSGAQGLRMVRNFVALAGAA